MDASFENHCRLTPKMAEEFVWNQLKWLKISGIVFTVLWGLSLASTLFLAVMEPPIAISNVIFLAVAACLLVCLWRIPHHAVKKSIHKVLEDHNSEMPESVIRFGEAIESNDLAGVTLYSYAQLRQVVSLKQSYMLVLDKNQGIPLDRAGFTEGTFEDFKRFLRTKRPDLKVPE